MKENSKVMKEALRYLGYKEQILDKDIREILHEAMDEINLLSKKRYVYKTFDIIKEENGLHLENTNLTLTGNDIGVHLSQSNSCILMAITLGHEIDTKIRYYEKTSMTKAMILDACATAVIEEISDKLCEEIDNKLIENNQKLTMRYSPGYGDLSLEIQDKLLNTLGGKSIGLTCSSHNILIPRKSITAIAGIVDIMTKVEERKCTECNKYDSCIFRKEDVNCGN